jgi:hypothetical protein
MKKSIFVLLLVTGLILASCNMPSGSSSQSDMMTAAAMTVQAILTPLNSPTAAVLATPVIASPQVPISTSMTSTQTGTPAATQTATATITPTYSIPMLTIKESTNCRSGPGQNYEIIFTFLPGASAEIVGQYPTDNYWIVKMPGSNDTCWIWGQYTTVSGSYWVVTTVTPPPTATVSGPERPGSLYYTYECPFGNLTTVINWADNADNETGYRVYRNNQLIAELPANSKTYTDNTTTGGTNVTYSVEAFNEAGTSERRTITFTCQ